MIRVRVVHPGSGSWFFTQPWSRIPDLGVKKAPDSWTRIWIRNTGCEISPKYVVISFMYANVSLLGKNLLRLPAPQPILTLDSHYLSQSVSCHSAVMSSQIIWVLPVLQSWLSYLMDGDSFFFPVFGRVIFNKMRKNFAKTICCKQKPFPFDFFLRTPKESPSCNCFAAAGLSWRTAVENRDKRILEARVG